MMPFGNWFSFNLIFTRPKLANINPNFAHFSNKLAPISQDLTISPKSYPKLTPKWFNALQIGPKCWLHMGKNVALMGLVWSHIRLNEPKLELSLTKMLQSVVDLGKLVTKTLTRYR